MSHKSFFHGLNTRLAKRRGQRTKRASKAKHECPLRDGDIFIGVYRRDTFEPMAKIPTKISGTSSGRAKTDKMGIAVYLDRKPGPYHYEVEYPDRYQDSLIKDPKGDFTLAGGGIQNKRSSLIPVGKLRVKVHVAQGKQLGDLVPAEHVLKIDGIGDPQVNVNEHLYTKLAVGEYRVSATVASPRYMPKTVTSDPVKVKEDKETLVILRVTEMARVKLKVHDVHKNKDLDNCVADLTLPDKTKVAVSTSNTARVAEAQFGKTPGKVTLRRLSTTEEPAYELVEITSA